MWQRKQSLFLVLAGALAFSTWFFPVATYDQAQDTFVFRTNGLYTGEGSELADVGMKVPIGIVITVVGLALLAIIFLYKDRPRQIRFLRGTYLLTLGVIAFLFITDTSFQGYLEKAGTVASHYGVSFFAPVLMLILTFLAERAIRADEALVRSADRLR